MLKKIIIFLTSLLLILNSALSHAFAIRQWNVSNPMAVGASILYDGSKGAVTSSVLITPNTSQVAKVLRGGLAGYALTFAVEQLLGAVDWVLDPANNSVKYKKEIEGTGVYGIIFDGYRNLRFNTKTEACNASIARLRVAANNSSLNYTSINGLRCIVPGYDVRIDQYEAPKIEEKNLPLETVTQKVIENAESDNLDAQFAVLAAVTNILSEAENDDAKADPIERELEENADDKCRIHNAYMNGQARIVEDRYNEMRADPLFLYRDYRTTPHPNGYGSWNGHQQRYTYEQGLLNQKILDAFFAGCLETAKAQEWKNKPALQKPDYAL